MADKSTSDEPGWRIEVAMNHAENLNAQIVELRDLADRRLQILQDTERQLAEQQTVLDAWQSVFGTSQLSYASARLELAERKVERLECQLAEAREENRALREREALA